MQTLIQVTPRRVFGRIDLLPANDLAKQFAALLCKPNIPLEAITLLRTMGYTVEEKHEATI